MYLDWFTMVKNSDLVYFNMKRKVIKYFLLLLAIAIFSWREVQILIDRGSWRAEEHLNVFWYTKWGGAWKLWDSFHVSNGMATMIMCYFFSAYAVKFKIKFLGKYQIAVLTILFWVVWMQIRNIFMGVI